MLSTHKVGPAGETVLATGKKNSQMEGLLPVEATEGGIMFILTRISGDVRPPGLRKISQ